MSMIVWRRLIFLSLILALAWLGFIKLNPFTSHAAHENENVVQCPVINDVSLKPFGEIGFDGPREKVVVGAFNDEYLHDFEHKVKVGLREQWGASLVFYGDEGDSPGPNASNTLDDSDPTRGLQMIFHDNTRPKWEARQSDNDPAKSRLRIMQSVRFVKSHVLEVEALITNLGDVPLAGHHEFPTLFASRGTGGTQQLSLLKNADGDMYSDGRLPATSAPAVHDLIRAPGGWATFQASDDQHGIGLYWENGNEQVHSDHASSEMNNVRSDFSFVLVPRESVRGRFYLLLGNYEQVRAMAESLDHSLPPFGRIDLNRIEEDTRTVTIEGWALDNKAITTLELWVDGKKIKDLSLNATREDICATYPGYKMCGSGHFRVGFSTTYQRPAGTGCERPVEVRAQDSDGNWRIIARQTISPVQYN